MKTTILCLIVAASLSVLVIATLLNMNREKKEGFLESEQQIGLGVGAGAAFLVVLFAVFFLYFYSFPKQPNVYIRRPTYYNLEWDSIYLKLSKTTKKSL